MSSTNDTSVKSPEIPLTDVGKVLPLHSYFHISLLDHLPGSTRVAVQQGIALTTLEAGTDFNVVKLSHTMLNLSFLDYPTFFSEAFPPLSRSWFIDLERKTHRYRTYKSSLNPPILHRKELLLPPDHPCRASFSQLTSAAEQIGLFDDPVRIGFRRSFEALIGQRGYRVVDHSLLPLGNDEASISQADDELDRKRVSRHLTALSRYNFSAPIQMLSRFGFLDGSRTVFDYGCGRGDDLRGLICNGIQASGWDPYYAVDLPKSLASIVNLGFVINVIEDIDERITALKAAYELAEEILVVSAMLANQDAARGVPYADGILTSRNTFQKYYSQAELKEFIDSATGNDAIAVGPGIFFVFKDKEAEQRFRYSRVKSRRRAIEPIRSVRPIKVVRLDRATARYEQHRDALEALWSLCLSLGRDPVRQETSVLQQDLRAFGSTAAALRFLKTTKDNAVLELDRAGASRADDLRVYFALLQFEKRPPYRRLEMQLQVDVKAFFGTYEAALAAGRELLFTLGDVAQIAAACRRAAEDGIGWLEDGASLQLHTDLVERLPPLLRAYVGCGMILYGDVTSADLLKIHISSGKLTIMKFDDFTGSPLPRMVQRVKINLRKQELTIFDYGEGYPPPYLYRKSRFINEESPFYAEQMQFEGVLDGLALFDLAGYGPHADLFDHKLEEMRLAVDGFRIVRSKTIPSLDQKCGRYLSFRDLIECGETQAKYWLDNLPRNHESFNALFDLAFYVLDPVIEYFGMVNLTFGFCSPELASKIQSRIAPHLDQHAAHERTRQGRIICERLGAACDFVIVDEDMAEVVDWMIANVNFDRIYFYGRDRPIHVSYRPKCTRQVVDLIKVQSGKLVPRRRRIG